MSVTRLMDALRGMPERERRALAVLVVFLAGAAVIQLAWSAYEASSELRRKLPELERRLVLARVLETRVQEFRSRPQVAQIEGERLRGRAQELAALRLAGLPAGALTLDGGRGIAFDATVSFDAWVEFVASLQQELSLRLAACEIAQGERGRARITARFVLADPSS